MKIRGRACRASVVVEAGRREIITRCGEPATHEHEGTGLSFCEAHMKLAREAGLTAEGNGTLVGFGAGSRFRKI